MERAGSAGGNAVGRLAILVKKSARSHSLGKNKLNFLTNNLCDFASGESSLALVNNNYDQSIAEVNRFTKEVKYILEW
jgi:hypothetical protein